MRRVFQGMVVHLNDDQRRSLAKNPRVRSIVPDARVNATSTQTSAPWGLDRIDSRVLPLDGKYSYQSTGSGVRAYVVDSGVYAAHAELAGRVAPGAYTVNDGWGTEDCNGHGTHVAGTIAGSTYGIAKDATIVPVRILGCDGGGYMSDVIAAVDWIIANHPGGPAVVNMSIGGPGLDLVDDAIATLTASGISVVVAAGNDNADACTASPAAAPSAITVGASDRHDQRASFSNHGSCVDLSAPGVSIRSAGIASQTATSDKSGTSMATPHVTGAVAVLLQDHPSWTPSQVTSTLKSQASTGRLTGLVSGTPNLLLYSPSGLADPALTSSVPTLSDTTPRVDQTLTAVPGTWGPSPVTLAYQWYRVTSTSAVAISGATKSSYKTQAADAGATLKVMVTGTGYGFSPTSRTSAATAAVAKSSFTTAPNPTISGTLKTDQSVTANTGTWSPTPSGYTYQWYKVTSTGALSAISGATAKTYRIPASLVGYRLAVKVTAARSGYNSASRTSSPSATVAKATLTTVTPTVTGTAKVNKTLTANPGTWGPGGVTLTYQWYRVSSKGTVSTITRATAKTYKLTSSDKGKRIKVRVKGTKTGYNTAYKYSALTKTVS